MLLVAVVARLVDAGVRDVDADPLPVRARQRVRRVDPTVRVEHVLGDVAGVHAHDRRADVLSRRHDEGEGQQGHHGDPVVQPEHGPVRVVPADLDEALEPEEEVKHAVAVLGVPADHAVWEGGRGEMRRAVSLLRLCFVGFFGRLFGPSEIGVRAPFRGLHGEFIFVFSRTLFFRP